MHLELFLCFSLDRFIAVSAHNTLLFNLGNYFVFLRKYLVLEIATTKSHMRR